MTSHDDAVRGTNTSATECKACAVKLGYYDDPYINHFVNLKQERRQPEINRGNFIRVRLVRHLIEQFMSKCTAQSLQYQIVNLGCGFDTLYWRLQDAGHDIKNFIETDFSDITSKKAFIINKYAELKKRVCKGQKNLVVANKGTDIHGPNYHLVAGDLRKFNELKDKLIKDCELDLTLPTLVLTECVLVYLPPSTTSDILTWFSSNFETVIFVNYEQVNLNTRFAQVMLDNLKHQNCDLLGKDACLSLETQQQRFLDHKFTAAEGVNVWDAYDSLPYDVRTRIERIEFLDEFEIMRQLLEHYCVCWGWKSKTDIDLTGISWE